jgi:integrase
MRSVNVYAPTKSKPGVWRVRACTDDGHYIERTAHDEGEARYLEKEMWATGDEEPRTASGREQFRNGTIAYPPTKPGGPWRVRNKRAGIDTSRRGKSAALAHARRLDEVLDGRNPRLATTRTIANLATDLIAHMAKDVVTPERLDAQFRLRYYEKIERTCRLHIAPVIGDVRLYQWGRTDTQRAFEALTEKGRGQESLRALREVLSKLVSRAHDLGWMPADRDPVKGVKYGGRTSRKQGQSVHFIPPETLPMAEHLAAMWPALEEVVGPPWPLAMELKAHSGLRWGELIALRPMDVAFRPHRRIEVHWEIEQPDTGDMARMPTKNRGYRDTIFPEFLVERLKHYVELVGELEGPDVLLFPGPEGGYCDRDWFRRKWHKAAKKAGWPMAEPKQDLKNPWRGTARWTPHDLRHYAACWMLFDEGPGKRRISVELVADYMGHTNSAFTMARYVGVRGDAVAQGNAATSHDGDQQS